MFNGIFQERQLYQTRLIFSFVHNYVPFANHLIFQPPKLVMVILDLCVIKSVWSFSMERCDFIYDNIIN